MKKIIAIKFGENLLFYVFLKKGMKEAVGIEGLRSLIMELEAEKSLNHLLKFFESVEKYFSNLQRMSVSTIGSNIEKIEIGTILFEGVPTIRNSYSEAMDFLKTTSASFGP
ncbi:hypothetical protein G6L00_09755 [Agrobacterium rhizogenes]|nr:hypothetical protein [Rhizobium rhizogenes]NTH38212.1 hypothetical protein [Rhizobium rhizogenes]NTJ00615.1 hypothetical protein [Rhizobium rhizogenes]